MIINGQRYEAEPAVEAYVKDLQAENEEQRREILRLTNEINKLDVAYYNAAMAITRLRTENARLEEAYQKATGVIAMDSLPTLAEMRKVSEMCKKTKCKKCIYFDKKEHYCRFDDGADHWNFGGKDDERAK